MTEVACAAHEEVELDLLLEAIFRQYHYDFRGYSRGSLHRRLTRAQHRHGCESLSQLQHRLLREPAIFADLMGFLRTFIRNDLDEFVANNVRLRIIGEYQVLAPDIVEMIEDAMARTAGNTGTTLAVALNYGSQQEIARAAARAAEKGPITPEAIEAELDTACLPPLDLLIRTSGEIRLSNFLLWQAAYAEMWFTDVLWPDFTPAHLREALDQFASRERRFGGR